MRFKHSVNRTIDQFSSVFKLFIYRIVTSLVFYSLIYLILHLGLSFIVKSAEFAELQGLVTGFFRALALSLGEGDANALTEFQTASHAAIADFASLLNAHSANIIGSIIGVAVIYILQRFTNGIAQFAIASQINDRMSVYARTRFSVAYFRNVGRAAKYYLVYVPLAFVYDLLSVVACWFLFFYVPSLMPGWGVFSVILAVAFTMAAVICLQALKLTVISSWMPAMIADGKSLFAALKGADIKKDFWRRLGGFIIACYLIVVVNFVFAVTTAGSGLLLTVPMSFVFLLVLQFVNYYEMNGKKYFLAKSIIWDGTEEEHEIVK